MESQPVPPFILLSVDDMRRAEALTVEKGIAEAALMENAGAAAAKIIEAKVPPRPTLILCGPGANGGDGFVIARKLKEAGWPVEVALLAAREKLTGSAAMMADLYDGDILPFSTDLTEGIELFVDALFGTGLSRPLEGDAAGLVDFINKHPAPIFAVDIPSGVDSNTGAVGGAAIQAAMTVTFFLKKPGHMLFPGRAFCGPVEIADIGISGDVLQAVGPRHVENHPGLWGGFLPRPGFAAHKYSRGAAAIISGNRHKTGASRLAARAALRSGAGVVTMLSPADALDEHAAHLTSIMIMSADNAAGIATFLKDERYRAFVFGPGAGVDAQTKEKTLAALSSDAGAILDADALTSFADDEAALFSALGKDDILTPHEGEFERLFSTVKSTTRLERAKEAAALAGAVVVLKGADTIIASPDGQVAINANAPGDLATAGSGDVLAGIIAGFRATGAPGFEAACAGVWFHGAAAQIAGPGLIAEDLPDAIPSALRQLMTPSQGQRPNTQEV